MDTATDTVRSDERAGIAVAIGLFCVTLATLTYEVLLTRIYSVMTWYHFAFVAVSIALFGMTAGALGVHLRPERFGPADLHRQLSRYSVAFAVTIVLSTVAQLFIPFADAASLLLPVRYFITAIPFYCSGVVVALVLTSFPKQVSRLYAADLAGAAFGSISVIWLLSLFDGPTAMVAVGVVAGLGAVAFATDGRAPRHSLVQAAGVTAIIAVIVVLNLTVRTDGRPPLYVRYVKGEVEPPYEQELWNAHSRVIIRDEPPGPPFGWAYGSKLPEDTTVDEKEVIIDGHAKTVMTRFDGDVQHVGYLAYDATNAAHTLRDDADVFVVGSGGGRDVLSSLVFHQHSVTAVEINKGIIDALVGRYGDYTGHLDQRPGVQLVNDEARSWLQRTDQRFDILQISLIDTWAASSAGAFALTENSLYTSDTWKLDLDRLKPHGILSVSWWQLSDRPIEVYRLLGLANHSLRQRGVTDPRQHVLLVSSAPKAGEDKRVATLLVSPDPFSQADRDRLAAAADRYGYVVELAPDHAFDDTAGRIADAPTDEELHAAVADVPADLSVPTDDRPFFFLTSKFSDVFGSSGNTGFLGSGSGPVSTLLALTVTTLLATLLLIIVPLRKTRDRMPAGLGPPLVFYFAGIGFGFLLIEIAQLQRLTVFLGHPTYALTVVLFSFLLFGGLGSLVSGRVNASTNARVRLAPLVALLVALVVFNQLRIPTIEAFASATTPVRALVAVLLLAPVAFLMGMPFPIGMTSASERKGPTVLLWAVNGATSVAATVVAVAMSLNFGISWSYWLGVAWYAVAVVSMGVLLRRRPFSSLVTETDEAPAARLDDEDAALAVP